MTTVEELALLLRPAGGGVHLVSSGRDAQSAAQRRLHRVATDDEVRARFRERLARIGSARAVMLGIPSDVGAGYLRGANQGPLALRTRLLEEDPDWLAGAEARGLLDLGDVFVVPQLLHDEMLSPAQLSASRRALYPGTPPGEAARLPVSPLSIAERALDLVLSVNPGAAPVLLGGDHSTAWPAVAALHRARPGFGVVQVDAHTDLLEERLGVKYCFGTWSFHANQLLGRGGRLVQVGIRVSRHGKAHWESTLGVRQVWADEVRADPAGALDAIVAAVRASGVTGVYFSNDVDGTDEAWVDATGTPETGGLEPDFVVELVRRLGREVTLVGGDVMEVAPPIARTPGGAERTLGVAARYLRATVDAVLGSER
ncbi:MAG: Arginase/agmatinase/formiminoglutamase [Anaeromyxobacteraceae bacterium]|nr:Arginase/agmatinase/formiminoglutamase [Anaeromyxobacteraceae bacterium]